MEEGDLNMIGEGFVRGKLRESAPDLKGRTTPFKLFMSSLLCLQHFSLNSMAWSPSLVLAAFLAGEGDLAFARPPRRVLLAGVAAAFGVSTCDRYIHILAAEITFPVLITKLNYCHRSYRWTVSTF